MKNAGIARTGKPRQITFNTIFIPDEVLLLKMPCWSYRAVLSLILNLKERNINLYESFTNDEICDALRMSYPSFNRARNFLAEHNLVSLDGKVLWNGKP